MRRRQSRTRLPNWISRQSDWPYGIVRFLHLASSGIPCRTSSFERMNCHPFDTLETREMFRRDCEIWIEGQLRRVGHRRKKWADACARSAPIRTPVQTRATGLTLAIAKRIVEAHSGKTWVESAAGDGFRFHFSILIANSKQKVSQKPHTKQRRVEHPRTCKRRICGPRRTPARIFLQQMRGRLRRVSGGYRWFSEGTINEDLSVGNLVRNSRNRFGHGCSRG
jgi:hypothetical protein